MFTRKPLKAFIAFLLWYLIRHVTSAALRTCPIRHESTKSGPGASAAVKMADLQNILVNRF